MRGSATTVLLVLVLASATARAQTVTVPGVSDDEVRARLQELDQIEVWGDSEAGYELVVAEILVIIPMLRHERHRDALRFNLVVALTLLRRCRRASEIADAVIARLPHDAEPELRVRWLSVAERVRRCRPLPSEALPSEALPSEALPSGALVTLSIGSGLAALSLGLGLGAADRNTSTGPGRALLGWSIGFGLSAAALLAVGLGLTLSFELE